MNNNVKLNSAFAFYELEKACSMLSDAFEAAEDEAVYKTIAQAKVAIRKAQNALLPGLQDNHDNDTKTL